MLIQFFASDKDADYICGLWCNLAIKMIGKVSSISFKNKDRHVVLHLKLRLCFHVRHPDRLSIPRAIGYAELSLVSFRI